MACTISTSEEPECVWMIQNSIYEWFIKLATQRYEDDAGVSSHLNMSVYTNGISLDIVYKKNPDLAQRIMTALKVVAEEVANGKHKLINEDGSPRPEMQEKCNSAFATLSLMLERPIIKVKRRE